MLVKNKETSSRKTIFKKKHRRELLIPNCKKVHLGFGLLNWLITHLPFELHLPGYQYCGPGTKFKKRKAKGQRGINKLDGGCMVHDQKYEENKDLESRNQADRVLLEVARERLRSTDASLHEKAAALAVAAAMKTKLKLGMGCSQSKKVKTKKLKRKRYTKGKGVTFKELANKARFALKNKKFISANDAIKTAIKAAKLFKGTKKVKHSRVIPIPKKGGFLPLLPIFAALGALGSIGGGAAAVAKAVNDAKAAKKQLEESKRHNQKMETIALGKPGSGLYMKPYKTGFGLFLAVRKSTKNHQ